MHTKTEQSTDKEKRYDPASFWAEIAKLAAKRPVASDKAFFVESNRTIH